MSNSNNVGSVVTAVAVIAILGVTGYVMFPKFARPVNDYPKSSSWNCMGNMNSLGKAFRSYLADYDNVLPSSALRGTDAWNEREFTRFAKLQGGPNNPTITSILKKYVGFDVAWCPDDDGKTDNPNATVSYWYKAANDKAWFDSAKTGTDYREPDKQLLMYEHTEWHSDNKKNVDETALNCLYMDGHVKRHMIKLDNNSRRVAHPLTPGEPAWYNYDLIKKKSLGKGHFCDPKTQGDKLWKD